MLNLAKGQKTIAVRQLNSAYEQLKSVGQRDSLLSYRLAKLFENSSELGAVLEFYTSALGVNNRRSRDLIDNSKPESLLEYARVLIKSRSYNLALGAVNYYETKFSANQSSQRMLVELNILNGQFDKAQEMLDSMQPDDVNRLQLNLELTRVRVGRLQNTILQKRLKEGTLTVFEQEDKIQPDPNQEESLEQMTEQLDHYRLVWAKLVRELLAKEPNSINENYIIALCNNYINENKIAEARLLVDQFMESHPDNTSIQFYKQMLLEPDPRTISEQRRRQIEEDVLSTISDPARKSMNLARLYYKYNEMDKAAKEFRKVLKLQNAALLDVDSPEALTAQTMRQLAASYAFEIDLALKDWVGAEQLTELSRKENMDDCEGRFFVARLALAKGEFEKALTELDECLKLRPVFSHAHLLKSNAYAALENYYEAAQEAQKAASLNPQDGTIAKALAFLLHSRNQNLGEKVTTEQLTETKKALLRATALNPRNLQLPGFYAEYISDDDPAQALAIRQRLQRTIPNVENALLLGRMAMRMAITESLQQRKEALFEIAASSFEQARQIDPNNRAVLDSMANYYRVRGEDKKAVKFLMNTGDQQLLWNHYLRSGQYDEAKSILMQLYQGNRKDNSVLRGLLFVAERELNRDDVKKYSEELLQIQDSVENRLLQIQTFLKIGLVNDVEPKLQSFNEKYAQDSRALLLEAWLAMRRGQLDKAMDLINRSLSEDENALAWRLRGRVNYLMTKSQEAIDDFKKSKSFNSDPTTRFLLARAYLKAGLNQDALTELQNTIDNPHAPAGARDLMEQIYLNTDDKNAIRRFYGQTLEKLDDSIDWHNRAGDFAVSEDDFDRAVALYGKALQIAVDRQQAPDMDTGDNRFRVSDYREALDGYLHSLLLAAGSSGTNSSNAAKLNRLFEVGSKFVDSKLPDVSAVAFLGMADAKMKINERQSALRYYKKALDKAFGGKDRRFARRVLQRVDSAITRQEVTNYCSDGLKANPDSVSANMAMFFLMNLSGQYNKSLQYIDKCLSLSTSDRNERLFYSVQKTNTLEAAYYKTSDNSYLERIIAEYESLLSEMPKNMVVLNNLAYILSLNNERLQDALEYSRRAHESAPDNPGFLDTYGYVLYKNNKLQEADEYLQAALQQYLQNRISAPAEVHEHLGMVKETLGHKAEAVEAYEQALLTGKESLSEAARERIKTAIKRLTPSER
jgi:tetratricopeptide (TPR) repeat protein